MMRLFVRGTHWHRCLSTAAQASQPKITSKEALMSLRRKTGYPFLSCKKALDKYGPYGLVEAEKWLHEEAQKEGWGKVDMTDRTAAQGVVAAAASGNYGVLLELNCETDFVAKNEKFRALASIATLCCLETFKSSHSTPRIEDGPFAASAIPVEDVLNCPSSEFMQHPYSTEFSGFQGVTMGDLLAFTLAYVKEQLSLSRMTGLVLPSTDTVVPYAHPRSMGPKKAPPVVVGHFAALVGIRREDGDNCLDSVSLGHQLCQHIVGMNPKELGTYQDIQENVEEQDEDVDAGEGVEVGEGVGEGVTKLNDEKRLLRQDFLLNPGITVAQYLLGHRADVVAFARFKCGDKEKI